ncbi:MAG: hypothetical protein AAF543_14435 [Pseudomonadota bacterium]
MDLVIDWRNVQLAGQAILEGLGAEAEDQLTPTTLFADVVEDLADQHAIILNRMREASMILPGQSPLLYEMAPGLFAAAAANEAEWEVPEATLVDVQMIGASGRVFMAGRSEDLERARKCIEDTLAAIKTG